MEVRGEEDGIINQIKFIEMLECYLAEDCIERRTAFYYLKAVNCAVRIDSMNANHITL